MNTTSTRTMKRELADMTKLACDYKEANTRLERLEMGYQIKVTGVNRNEIKDYIHEQFAYALDNDVDQWSSYPAPKATTNAA